MRFLSVCSGIEAASVAWNPLGWKAVAFSEIEPFPCAVLAHHYPDTPNWGDMTKYKEWPDVSIDLLCGGIHVDRRQVYRIIAAAFRLRNDVINLGRGQHAASAFALVALAQVAVALQDQYAQSIPVRAIPALMSAAPLAIRLPAHGLASVLVAVARFPDQRSAAAMAARQQRPSCNTIPSSFCRVLPTAHRPAAMTESPRAMPSARTLDSERVEPS